MTADVDPKKGEEMTEVKGQESAEAIRDMVAAAGRSVQVKLEVPVSRTPKALADAPSITPRRIRPGAGSRWRRRVITLVVLAGGAAAIAYYREPIQQTIMGTSGPKTAVALANIQTYSVKRGELRITMVEEGKLRAVNTSPIKMGINGKITWLAEAGSRVKKGDKLATVDAKQYEDEKKRMEAEVEAQQKQLEIAEKQIPMAEVDGKSAVATATNVYETAIVTLTQYKTVDVPKKLNELDTAINEARTKQSDQSKKRIDLQTQLDQMLSEGSEKVTLQNNLSLAKQQETSMRRALQNVEDQRKVFRAYNYPQDLKTKQGLVDKAFVDVEKAKVNAENNVLAKKADAQRIRNSIIRMQSNIKQYDEMIAKATAYAPTDGLVFYGGQDPRYGSMPADQIRVGADWYSQYPIMSIPDLSSFAVDVPIAEVYRGRVSTGMPASVTIDAVPGLLLSGKITTVSSVSRPKYQYDSGSPPVYDSTLALSLADERMVAGMTVRVEIVTGVLPSVLHVPVEAVFNEEGKTAAFFWIEGEKAGEGHVEIRPVLTGQASDHFVELKAGANENDRLLLSRPAAYVTPTNYREMVDAIFPAGSIPVMAMGPTTAPTTNPADAMSAQPTTNPANVIAAQPASRPAGRSGRPPSAPAGAEILPGVPVPIVN